MSVSPPIRIAAVLGLLLALAAALFAFTQRPSDSSPAAPAAVAKPAAAAAKPTPAPAKPPAPATRPGVTAVRLTGFAARETVAQGAANASS